MNSKKMHRLMNETGGDAGGTGGGAVGAAPGGDTSGQASAPAPAAQQAQAPASVLSGGAAQSPWSAPEKYLVKGEDGSPNWEATARKIDEGRSHLEKRFGSGDVPPADIAGYKLAVPEQYAEVLQGWDPSADTKLQAFLGDAHKVGFTQPQVDLVLREFGRVTADMKTAGQGPSPEQQAEQVATQLREVWKDDAEFDKNVGFAYKAANALAAKAGLSYDDIEAAGLGNNPAFLRIAAALGPEMGEDSPVGTQGQQGQASEGWKDQVAQLKAEKNGLPERDPRRQTLQNQINSLYDKHVKV
jgi:hypothetical protein